MRTKTMLCLAVAMLLAWSCCLEKEEEKFIEVTGSAEKEVAPDKVKFVIGMEEYFKEEFIKHANWDDFKTKVTLEEIEKNIVKELDSIGIKKDRIKTSNLENFWRYSGKKPLLRKQIEISLTDMSKVDEIVKAVKTRGVNNMRIKEFDNSKMTQYRKEVKTEALKAAQEKATYLLESVNKKPGEIISITEIEDKDQKTRSYWSSWYWGENEQQLQSNYELPSDNNSDKGDNMRMIKLRYEIRVKFEIED